MMNTDSGAPPVIEIADMTKTYIMGKTKVHALRGLSLTIRAGEYVAIIGASGDRQPSRTNRPPRHTCRIRSTPGR